MVFHYIQTLSSISCGTTFLSFTMWGAAVLIEWLSPGQYLCFDQVWVRAAPKSWLKYTTLKVPNLPSELLGFYFALYFQVIYFETTLYILAELTRS